MRRSGSIGPLSVNVHGDGPLVSAIARELAGALMDSDRVDLDIEVGSRTEFMKRYAPTTFSAKTHMSFNEREFSADEPVRFVIADLFEPNATCHLLVDDRSEPRVAYLRRRFGRTIDAHPALSYALLWFVVHVRLLGHGASSIHAGIVDAGGSATAIAGTGGSGKTSLLFSLLEAPGARYLAEDFGILGTDGTVHLSPKAVSIYSSDLHAGSVGLDAYVAALVGPQRLKWQLHRRLLRTTPMVKAPIRAILPADRIGTTAPLGRCLYLIRTSGSAVRARETGADDIARRLTDVAWREHKRLLELVRMIRANAGPEIQVPTVEALTEETMDVLRAGLARAASYLVEVPATAGPDVILEALRRDGILE